jgi:hypothetical protein
VYGATGIKPLAFQAAGQSCAFYPDSSSAAADKLNVRQGRYDIWGPEHLVVNVDGTGNPVGVSSMGANSNTAAVNAVITALTATANGPSSTSGADAGAPDGGGAGLTEAQVKAIIDGISKPGSTGGVVPWCAMEVNRTGEDGPLSSYQSPYPCTCEYENATAATVHSHACTTCTSDMDCADAGASLTHCRYGYCEAN